MSGTKRAAGFDEHEVPTARRTYPNLAEEQERSYPSASGTSHEPRSGELTPKRTQSGTRRRAGVIEPPPIVIVRGEREERAPCVPISPKSLVAPRRSEAKRYPRTLSPVVFVPSQPVVLPSAPMPPPSAARARAYALVAVVVALLVAASAAGFFVGRGGLP